MQRVIAILALSAAGCFTATHLSTVGPYVRTVEPHDGGIVVQSCTIKRFDQTQHSCLNVLFNLTPDHTEEFKQDQCFGSFVSLGPDPVATPPAEISQ
ncbi:MAG TPA: hypothetical protein VH165_33745 [Kofleriaceae bacterium]|jgi:hypothetical protein|nr:hypothetical protein [Kofleriaceae bacterium]